MPKYRILICSGVQCRQNFSKDIETACKKAIGEQTDQITVDTRACMNLCEKAPNLMVVNEETSEVVETCSNVSFAEIKSLIEKYLIDR